VLILDTDLNASLEVLLAAAPATTQLSLYEAHVDIGLGVFEPGATNAATNGTTAVSLVAMPGGGNKRQVKYISIYNGDTANATVTIRLVDDTGANPRILVKKLIKPGERIEYVDTNGFVFPAAASTGGGGSGTVESVVSGSGIIVDNTDPTNPVVSAVIAPPDSPHEYWRLTINAAAVSTTYASVASLELAATPGGTDQCTGGTASASSEYGVGNEASKAFDGNPATNWSSASGSFPKYLQYHFAAPVSVQEMRLRAVDSSYVTLNENPKDFDLAYSDDGVVFTTVTSVTGASFAFGEEHAYQFAPSIIFGIVAGTNIDVDVTDPMYPVISADLSGKQDIDADLTAIAGLSPTNDDVLQRKAGAWINRSPAQLKSDLALSAGDMGLGSVDNTSDASKPVSTAQAAAIAAVILDSIADGDTTHAPSRNAVFDALALKADLSLVGTASGIAPLDGSGKVATTYLPAAVLGQVEYQGTWDATSGSAPSGSPEKGWYYIVTVAGTTSISGIAEWAVGDWIIYNGTAWNKVDNTDAVSSVAGLTGVISGASLKTALSLVKGDVGLASVDNTADASKNVATAATLATSRNIDGQAFNGSADITVIAPGVHAATSKATPVDADELGLVDSAASNVLKKLTWSNLKATLQTFFDSRYRQFTPRVDEGTTATAITPDLSAKDASVLTALGSGLTINAPTGGSQEQKYMFRFKDDGTPRALTWNAAYVVTIPGVTLPTTTTAGKVTRVGGIYNSTLSRMEIVAAGQEA
jgi:hypothetical protein